MVYWPILCLFRHRMSMNRTPLFPVAGTPRPSYQMIMVEPTYSRSPRFLRSHPRILPTFCSLPSEPVTLFSDSDTRRRTIPLSHKFRGSFASAAWTSSYAQPFHRPRSAMHTFFPTSLPFLSYVTKKNTCPSSSKKTSFS